MGIVRKGPRRSGRASTQGTDRNKFSKAWRGFLVSHTGGLRGALADVQPYFNGLSDFTAEGFISGKLLQAFCRYQVPDLSGSVNMQVGRREVLYLLAALWLRQLSGRLSFAPDDLLGGGYSPERATLVRCGFMVQVDETEGAGGMLPKGSNKHGTRYMVTPFGISFAGLWRQCCSDYLRECTDQGKVLDVHIFAQSWRCK